MIGARRYSVVRVVGGEIAGDIGIVVGVNDPNDLRNGRRRGQVVSDVELGGTVSPYWRRRRRNWIALAIGDDESIAVRNGGDAGRTDGRVVSVAIGCAGSAREH